MSSDIENSMLSQFKASFLSFQGAPDISSAISQEKNVLNRTMKVSSSFVQFQGNSEYFPLMPVRAVKSCFKTSNSFLWR